MKHLLTTFGDPIKTRHFFDNIFTIIKSFSHKMVIMKVVTSMQAKFKGVAEIEMNEVSMVEKWVTPIYLKHIYQKNPYYL